MKSFRIGVGILKVDFIPRYYSSSMQYYLDIWIFDGNFLQKNTLVNWEGYIALRKNERIERVGYYTWRVQKNSEGISKEHPEGVKFFETGCSLLVAENDLDFMIETMCQVRVKFAKEYNYSLYSFAEDYE